MLKQQEVFFHALDGEYPLSQEQEKNPTPSKPHKLRRSARVLKWGLRIGGGLLCALALGIALVVQTASFQEWVRSRLVSALEQATGARVELEGFSVSWARLQVSLEGLTLHGREGPQEPPLFSARLIQVEWTLRSAGWVWWSWSLQADLNRIRLWEPKIYLAAEEGGRTNVPPPSAPKAPGRGQWEVPVFALQARHLEVLRGQFQWNQKRLPLDFRVENFRVALDYQSQQGRYFGRLDLQNVALTSRNVAPLPSQGRLQVSLYPDRLQIESLEWQTPKSRLQARGEVRDFLSPRLRLQYDLLLDWEEAADLLGGRGWEGKLDWRGEASYGVQGWQLAGNLDVHPVKTGIAAFGKIPWSARSSLRLVRPSSEAAEAESSHWLAEFQDLQVTALGGHLTGSASVEMASPSPRTRLDLQAQRISFPALAQALTMLPVPLARLQWAGAVSGPVQASFTGKESHLTIHTDGQVDRPPVVPPGFTPVSGVFRGSYQADQGRLRTEGSYIELPQTRLSAEGWLEEQASHLTVAFDSTNFGECRLLVEHFRKEWAELPVSLSGRAGGELLWTGGKRQPVVNANFDLSDFAFRGARWDRFSGNLNYRRGGSGEVRSGASTAELNIKDGRLIRGSAVIQFDGSLGLENGIFGPQSPFSVEATLRETRIEELQKLAGAQYPLQGILQASLKAWGTRQDPQSQGTVTITDGAAYQEPIDRITAEWTLTPEGVLSIRQLRLQKGKGTAEGSAVVGLKTRRYQFALTGSNLAIEEFRVLRTPRFPVTGLAQAKISAESTFSHPQVRAQIEVSRLGLNGQREGKLSLDVQTQDREADVQLKANLFQGEVRGNGKISLAGTFPFSGDLNFANLDMPQVLRTLQRPMDALQGSATGIARVEGNGKDVKAMEVRGELSHLDARLGPIGFRNQQPLRYRYQNDLVEVEQVHLIGPDLDLEASGTIRLSADPTLDLAVKGRTDLGALAKLDPKLSSSGMVLLDAQLGGTLERPLWRGRLVFSEGNFRYGEFPNSLVALKGAVVFDGNRGVLEEVNAESGGGQLKLDGFVSYARPTGWQLQIGAEASGVRVRYPQGVSTLLNGSLSLQGTTRSSFLAGRLVIQRQSVSPQMDLAAVLARSREEAAAGAMPEFLQNMRLDLEITSAPDIQLKTAAARNLQGDVELHIQGTVEHPSWLGRIGLVQGELYFAGRRYSVNRGEITFLNPFRIEPILSLSLQARVQQNDISLEFTGPADHLKVTYRSDPPLPTSDILALLVAGSSREATVASSPRQGVPQIGAEALLSQALNAQIGSRLDRIFGTGRIRIDPQLAGFGRPANASIAFEQQIKDDLTLLYITSVTSVQEQTIQAEWTISPRFSVVGIRDQNGLIGVNLQLKLRLR